MLAEEIRSMLCMIGGKAPPDVVGRFRLIMLIKGGKAGRLDLPSLEAELGFCMYTSVVRTVA